MVFGSGDCQGEGQEMTWERWEAIGRQRYEEWEAVNNGYLGYDIEQGFWKAWEDAWEVVYGSESTVES